jgi:phosphoribosyl-AMP cyclohydrolase
MTNTVSTDNSDQDFLDQLRWNTDGLIPAIAQDYQSNEILMMAWMSREALALTVKEQRAIYWSRSRKKLWRKGEESGHLQILKEIRLDCDEDVVILKVEQKGGMACHTGRRSCFYRKLENNQWKTVDGIIKNPKDIYQ